MLSKDQSRQLKKLKNLYWTHCMNDRSQMMRVDNHYLFRDGKTAKRVSIDDDIVAEFEKSQDIIFMACLF
jgi:hypothetical protein